MIDLRMGDCLELMRDIPDGSVDLILTDLPYGNMKGAELDGWGKDRTNWDIAIEPRKVHGIANRTLRKNGKMVLFSQEPYTTNVVSAAIPNMPFLYRMIWEKDHFANALLCKKSPVSFFEDILVFGKKNPICDSELNHPLRQYFKCVMDYIGMNLKQMNARLGGDRAEHSFYVTPRQAVLGDVGQTADHVMRFGTSQFSLCTEATYKELVRVFGIDKMEGFMDYEELAKIDAPYRSRVTTSASSLFPSTFNLWEGNKYKGNILKYKKDYGGYHPTQKPVSLLEDIIKTFSNAGDLVADLTMGSGSTGVACVNTNRNFIGFELDPHYFAIAQKRIYGASAEPVPAPPSAESTQIEQPTRPSQPRLF